MADDIDDDDLPSRLPMRRVCVHSGCRKSALGDAGKRCREHHAAYIRAWRAARRLRGELAPSTSSAAPSASSTAVRDRVRTSRARAKGSLQTYPCAVCNIREGVVALRPTHGPIVWGHRACRGALVDGNRSREAAQAVRATNEAQASSLVASLARFSELPIDIADRLRVEAGRGPIPLRVESPLFQQRLGQLISQYFLSAKP